MSLISFQDAYDIIQSKARDFGTERIPLNQGIGQVLRQNWKCDRDLPPYDRVTMDGIAINYDGAQGTSKLQIERTYAAGDPEGELMDSSHCVEIMTGAMLPKNADTIIRYEDVLIENGYAKIQTSYKKHQNLHWKGQDRKRGDLVVPTNTLLSASEIGVGASIGQHNILVSKLPKTIVISTGDELVPIDTIPAPHQIRRSNVYRMEATLTHLGIPLDTAHLKDDKDAIVEQLTDYLDRYDLIILSGGVSKGKFDFLPEALAICGVQKHFHKIAQRPGKPLWFGSIENGTTVFALPGNPVSSFMCLTIYVIDWLRSSIGLLPLDRPMAVLNQDVTFNPDLTYFLEVKLSYSTEGQIIATPKKGNGSGDLANLLNGDAFIKLPRGKNEFRKGEVYPVYNYR